MLFYYLELHVTGGVMEMSGPSPFLVSQIVYFKVTLNSTKTANKKKRAKLERLRERWFESITRLPTRAIV